MLVSSHFLLQLPRQHLCSSETMEYMLPEREYIYIVETHQSKTSKFIFIHPYPEKYIGSERHFLLMYQNIFITLLTWNTQTTDSILLGRGRTLFSHWCLRFAFLSSNILIVILECQFSVPRLSLNALHQNQITIIYFLYFF